MKNIIVYGIKEPKGTNQVEKWTQDIKETQRIFPGYSEVNLGEDHVGKVIHLGKYEETKKRPLLISIETEEKRKELFQNLHMLRKAPDNISVTHDLTKKQREELKELMKEAKKKEENDQLGNYMYRVRSPPWGWFIKKINKT